ncbi:unnamed protein product [Peronospora belbahrii]|uniref:Uncharacterized protein n=1 Tax=Peronospora belbahrii TaxID=622444 RepID=A0AAU9L1S0_9STRA|nr:unnamed protein product [Peronospora belbahrii]
MSGYDTDFNRWRKKWNKGDMSVMPCALRHTTCYAILYYAYATGDMIPLSAATTLGVDGVVLVTRIASFCYIGVDVFILASTIAEFSLSVSPLSLSTNALPEDVPVVTCRNKPAPSVVLLSPIQDGKCDRQVSSVDSQRSSSFVALRSPA